MDFWPDTRLLDTDSKCACFIPFNRPFLVGKGRTSFGKNTNLPSAREKFMAKGRKAAPPSMGYLFENKTETCFNPFQKNRFLKQFLALILFSESFVESCKIYTYRNLLVKIKKQFQD